MARFLPFKGYLPDKSRVVDIVSRPFDNYSKEDVERILESNNINFLNVIVPTIPNYGDGIPFEEKLKNGKQKFDELVDQNVFNLTERPAYYIYRQTQEDEQYTGIIGAISIDDCIGKVVKPHEQTLEKKEEKLKEYLKVIDINAEPVVITYKADHDLNDLVTHITKDPAEFSFDNLGFGHHELWPVNDPRLTDLIRERFEAFDEVYIADGHHRTASSVLYGQEMRNEKTTGKEAYNYFMALMFPHHQIRLREFNRIVKDLNGLNTESFLKALEQNFSVAPSNEHPDISDNLFAFGVYVDDQWYRIDPKPGVIDELQEDHQLPTQALTDLILSPVLEIHDLRRDNRIDFVGGQTDYTLLESKVKSGKFAAAFTVNKIHIPLFKKFADKGWSMPPKSTWFEPKLLSGLVIYSLKEEL